MSFNSAVSTWLVVLGVLASVSPAFSRELAGGARDLLSSSTCTVSSSAKAYSFNQLICKSEYKKSQESLIGYFCRNPNDPVPAEIEQTVYASAVAVAEAVATASTKVSMTASISPSCEEGSYAYFDALVRAKAVAKAVAQSFASAYSVLIGEQAWAAVGVNILAVGEALAVTCETQYLATFQYHTCKKGSCSTSSCPISCTYDPPVTTKVATAEAIAQAYADAQAIVETYYNTDQCDDACERQLCGYVCPGGCA